VSVVFPASGWEMIAKVRRFGRVDLDMLGASLARSERFGEGQPKVGFLALFTAQSRHEEEHAPNIALNSILSGQIYDKRILPTLIAKNSYTPFQQL
jgi:hypothetical protein